MNMLLFLFDCNLLLNLSPGHDSLINCPFFYKQILVSIMTMKKLHEHYPGAVDQTVAGLIQLAAEEACMGKSPLSTYMVLADLAEEYGLI